VRLAPIPVSHSAHPHSDRCALCESLRLTDPPTELYEFAGSCWANVPKLAIAEAGYPTDDIEWVSINLAEVSAAAHAGSSVLSPLLPANLPSRLWTFGCRCECRSGRYGLTHTSRRREPTSIPTSSRSTRKVPCPRSSLATRRGPTRR
jgi:hypothetical protein